MLNYRRSIVVVRGITVGLIEEVVVWGTTKKKDYKAIKRGVLSPITSAKNKSLILSGQDSKKTMLQSNMQSIRYPHIYLPHDRSEKSPLPIDHPTPTLF
jgi:hypothetical protein